jgi:hypothetical protein
MGSIKTYEAIYEPLKNKGVYGISLVENPAMEGHFIALSEDAHIQLKTIDEEERILIGLVLEPNKPIYRNQDGEEFNIVFSEATIKELSHGFYKGGFQKNSSLEHNNEINGVTFVESWIIADPKNDKSNALGLSYPKGSWMATMKVDSQEVWDDYVKTGKVKGFSIDAMVSLKEVKLKSDIKMSEQTIVDAIEKGFANFLAVFKGNDKPKETTVELASIKTSDGEVEINYEGETLMAEGRVWIVAEDGIGVPLPAGDYELEDGRILVVAEDGKVAEVKDAVVEEMSGDPAAPSAEQVATQTDAQANAIQKAMKSILIKYGEELTANLTADFDAKLSVIKKEHEEKLLALSKEPAAKPVKVAPTSAVPSNAKERILETIQNVNNN